MCTHEIIVHARSGKVCFSFRELRSLCARVRFQVYAHEGYQECVEGDHQHCGFQDGIELSAFDVGTTVKSLHAEIELCVFSGNDLLRGMKI